MHRIRGIGLTILRIAKNRQQKLSNGFRTGTIKNPVRIPKHCRASRQNSQKNQRQNEQKKKRIGKIPRKRKKRRKKTPGNNEKIENMKMLKSSKMTRNLPNGGKRISDMTERLSEMKLPPPGGRLGGSQRGVGLMAYGYQICRRLR